jgi:DNA replication protein DnaC
MQTVLGCHKAAFEALGGVPREILYDRMKTAVIGEDEDGRVVYNRTLGDLAHHYGFLPKACRPYRPETKGKVERPFRYIREDFFLGSTFRDLDDLNLQLKTWLGDVANPRVHATTGRVVNEAFAEEKPTLLLLPLIPFGAVLKLDRRISCEGMVSVGGNYYSVPDATRRRVVEVRRRDPDLRGRSTDRPSPAARWAAAAFLARWTPALRPAQGSRPDPAWLWRRTRRAAAAGLLRGRRTAPCDIGRCSMSSILPDPSASLLDRIKASMVGLKMPRAIEVVDRCVARLDHGEITALKAIEQLLLEELTFRENRRIKTALVMGRLGTIKTLAGFDFSFQPSLDKARIMALAELNFVERCEVVHVLGPPGTGKSHLATALGVEAVKAGKSVYFIPLADLIGALSKAEREGTLRERIRFYCRPALLIVDEIGYLPVVPGGGNLFFQLVNARYEKGSMILTSNRGFAEWGEIFGSPVVATALLDRLLHHAIVVQIEGSSYRLRRHADLLPEQSARSPALPRQAPPTRNAAADRSNREAPTTIPPDPSNRKSGEFYFATCGESYSDIDSFDTFDFTAIPGLNKMLVLELARCEFILRRENVIALGNSGTGKTHVALALGLAACQKGFPVAFTTAAALLHQLMEARDERRLLKLQRELQAVKLLIVDELGYVPLSPTGAELLFEVLSQRYERGSTIITSNLPFEDWTSVLGSERLTGALLDRLTHHVHILTMNGDSYRLKQSSGRRRADAAERAEQNQATSETVDPGTGEISET